MTAADFLPPTTVSIPKRSLSIGGATFDLFVSTGAESTPGPDGREMLMLPLGEKLRARDVTESFGGGACNTSVGLARLGLSAAFCGVVGDDQWGDLLVKNLRKETVNTDLVTVVEGETSSFSLVFRSKAGERVILYDPGTNAHLHDVTFDRDEAATMDVIYLNHIQPESCVIEDDMIEMVARIDGPHLTWNPGGCQIDAGLKAKNNRQLLEHCYLLLLNKEEAERFTGVSGIERAMRLLREAGVEIVCITDGKRGSWAADGTHLHFCPSAGGPVVDTTGAGDAFGTGVTWALSQGMDLPTALSAGTINAMSVVGTIGAQPGLLTDIEMRGRLTSIRLDIETSVF